MVRKRARDLDRNFARHAAGRPIRGRHAHRHRLVSGPSLAHGIEDLEGKPQPILDRSAVFVRPTIGQGRDKARQQVAVRAVQFEHVEACAVRPLYSFDEMRLDEIHVAHETTSRGTWLSGK